jgi:transposase
MSMTATRRHFTAQEKVQILRLNLLEHQPVSEVCDQYKLSPTIFYRWQKDLFEHGVAAFERVQNGPDRAAQKLQKENAQLQDKLARKDEVIAEIMQDHVRLKKELGLG